MTQRNPIVPGQGAEARVAEEHRLAREAYASTQSQRTVPNVSASLAVVPVAARIHLPEPSDLDTAIRVGQRMLGRYGDASGFDIYAYAQAHGGLSEALRILLHALGAEPHRPTETAEPDERCPAAHPEDPTPCSGPAVVTVLDATNAGANGCEHHGARLLASIEGGRVYALPDAPGGAAIRVFKAADGIRPFPWLTDAPRTRPSQLSHEENRSRGDKQ